MNVPFVDLSAQYVAIRNEIREAMDAVLADRTFIRGPHVADFEKDFATFCGANHCIGVGSGTDALTIALRSLGIGPGHEVLVPANTFIATSEAVTLAGAHPVFVDVHPDTSLMDLDAAEAKITSRTRAIIPVHLFGQPVDMAAVRTLAEARNLLIVQDCAQAHGATVDGRPLADFGDACCYSFFPGKNLGAYGDAGAIVVNDPELATRCRMTANHGRIGKYDHEFEGMNSRMDGLQGAVLRVKLFHLEAWTEARRANAARYAKLLADVPGISLPVASPGRRHVYHLYVIRHPWRDALQAHLKARGVATGVHYPIALPNLTAYAGFGHKPEDFPVASRLSGEILSLPMYAELTSEQAAYVAQCLREFNHPE
ncbi:DegT/DnrJ/EryC1/StrS family aminotransferase [Solidesulfovibrio sp. C21]|uniref:DegT/DnrJ/EryC1/StrS family aminotransferase n=1 Tax=Solidesulfovibrio sp. C21 TaxID=3398613 RepID=UPI0039FBEC31